MARPSNRDERRAQILDALRRTMAVHGYERATTAMIAREAGLATGLVHYHFASKSEILLELVRDLVSRADARIDARVARASSSMGQVDAILDAVLARDESMDVAMVQCWTLVSAEAVKSDEVRVLYSDSVERLTTRLARALVGACHEDGRTGEGSRAMAGALVALIQGCFALASTAPSLVPVGTAASMAKRMVRGLVAAQLEKEAP